MMILTLGHTNTFGSQPRVLESTGLTMQSTISHSFSPKHTAQTHTRLSLSASAPPVLPTHLSSWLDWLVLFWDQELQSATMKENSFLLHLLAAQDIQRAFHLADCLSEADSIHLYLYHKACLNPLWELKRPDRNLYTFQLTWESTDLSIGQWFVICSHRLCSCDQEVEPWYQLLGLSSRPPLWAEISCLF